MNMGKFPGKPSKIVNRKRVNASKCPSSQENDSLKAAENIYFGLTVFNEAFGSEQVTADFLGFTPQEIKAAVVCAKKQHREVEAEYAAHGLTVSLKENFEKELQQLRVNQCQRAPTKNVARRTRKQCFDGGGGENSDVSSKDGAKREVPLLKKLISKSPPNSTTFLKNKAAKKILQKAKKTNSFGNGLPVDAQQDKSNGVVRKFVLPSRSVHSSRVIKPNKRFIEGEEVLSDLSANKSASVIQLKKPRLIVNSSNKTSELPSILDREGSSSSNPFLQSHHSSKEVEQFSGYNSSDGNSHSLSPQSSSLIVEGKRRWKPSYKVQLKLRELNVFGAGTARFPLKRTQGSSSCSTRSVPSTSEKEKSEPMVDDKDSRRFYGSAQSETKQDLYSGHRSGPKLNGSKVILRKARLKLNSDSSLGTDGPFSGNIGSGNSVLPATVQCGVCGAVRFYRFVKQAVKFGIYSCESCRKFISQMVKRQACHKGGTLPILQCYKGEGTCNVPPILHSQQWKPGRLSQIRCSYKSRCPACWLKKCIRSFKMPDALRSNMIQMLPVELRRDVEKPSTSYPMASDRLSAFIKPPLLEGDRPRLFNPLEGFGQNKVGSSFQSLLNSSWQSLSSPLSSSSARARRKTAHNAAKQLGRKHKQKDRSSNSISDKAKKAKHLHSNKILKKATKKLGKSKGNLGSPTEHMKKKNKNSMKMRKKNGGSRTAGSDENRRQKLDLKGPRVKHVCRSASIVLGQPQATFPSIEKKAVKTEEQLLQESIKVNTKNSCCSDSSVKSHDGERSSAPGEQIKVTKIRTPAETSIQSSQPVSSGDGGLNGDQENEPPASQTTTSGRKVTKPVNASAAQTSLPTAMLPQVAHTLPMLGKRPAPEHLNQISIDFWESYDPEEVANTGFGLIGSEPFHVRATCFLCGSAGREKLVHCALCCEPYHVFCLEDGSRDLDHNNGEEWRYNWVCQRCTVCHLCGRGLGQQLSCQRCHRTYHTECLGSDRLSSRLHSPDRPWVCSTCLRCKSCGAADVTVFVGNLPLCKVCFKLRQKGNYCPLCQRCYEDDDYDTKMMECGKCRCWVHARCEGLSDEKYQVLSYLPDSVEFVCRTCSASVRPRWRIAVEEELKAGYLGVLKALSKNRKACAMLKWSPKKQCLCRSALVAKRLDFQETSDRETETDDQSDSAKEDARVIEKHIDTAHIVPSFEVKKLPLDSEPSAVPENQESAFQNCTSKEAPKNSSESAAIACVSEAQTDPMNSSAVNEQQPLNITSSTEARLLHVGSNKALKHLREKFKIKECSVRVENCIPKPSPKLPLTVKIDDHDSVFSPDSYLSECSKSPPKIQVTSMATPASDSGIGSTDDEFKPSCIEEVDETKDIASGFSHAIQTSQLLGLAYAADRHISELETAEKSSDGQESVKNEVTKECFCLNQHSIGKPSPTLLSIKKKVSANEYSSLSQFHQEMEQLIGQAQCADLLETYHHSLKEVFPWFDPKYARVDNNWKDGRPVHEENGTMLSIKSDQEHSTSEELPLNKSITPTELDSKASDSLLKKDIIGRSDEYYYSGYTFEDRRVCTLCKGVGDGLPVEEGRLLYCGQNEWVHANCALWSAEVFEEIDGSLQNVHSAVSRGRMIRCRSCGKKGASVGCCARNCAETFHFPCARRVGCAFMDDKSVFCRTHLVEADGKPLHLDVEFDIRRPIYVELDRKKKKYVEAHQVRFMIGSLMVESLGEFVPASDNPDIIVPADFRCTRLYWSSIEPWRLVRYYIRTMVKAAEPQLVLDLGKNLTVDHTQEQKLVKQKLDEVSRWHQQLICSGLRSSPDKTEMIKFKCPVVQDDGEEKLQLEESEEEVVRQLLDNIVDVVCNKDVDDSCLADPQAAADLLPPELKDAIFEDLPHDLLDGISMQDIFPKLLNCEDLVTMDLKAEECFVPDVSKENCDDLLQDDVDQVSPCEDEADHLKCRKSEQTECELGTQTDLWFPDAKEQDNVESKFHSVYMRGTAQKNTARELKRSKSEVIPQTGCKSGRSHQRSCSLTWTCKLDGSTKRRKAVRGAVPRTGGESGSSLLMVVDSDKAHMLQELRLPDGVLVALARSDPSVAESVRELKCRLEEGTKKEEGKENKCLLWHGVRSQPRILQLDGAMDSGSSSGSEMGSPPHQMEDHDYYFPTRSLPNNFAEEEPVKCDRCHRTYRTRISFERHLPTCSSDFTLSTSESDSENTRSSEEETSGKPKMAPVNRSQSVSQPVEKDVESVGPLKSENAEEAVVEAPLQATTKKVDADVPSHVANPQPRVKPGAVRGSSFNGRSRGRTPRPQPRKETATRKENSNPQVVVSMPASSPQTQTMSCQSQTTPTVIMQQVQSPNMVPAFVEAFQQQTGQSLQYIATIDAHSNNFSKPQYLATSVPGTFQLQSAPEGYVGLQNGGISMLPGVQIAAPQPAVIGTLIHQTPPTTIQCVAAEQVVLGSTPALEMYTDQTGGMYLASQPMYYGLETIVSNTVMSSSQFVSAAVPGMMAASSSFSATTTQVFQASKIVEPVVDCPPPGFVIVNQAPPAAEHPGMVPRPDLMSCPQQPIPANVPAPTILPQQPQAAPVLPPQPMSSPQAQPIPPPQPQQLVPPAAPPPPLPPQPPVQVPQPEPPQPIPQQVPPSSPQISYPWRYSQQDYPSPEPPTSISVTRTYGRAPRQPTYSNMSNNATPTHCTTHCKCNQQHLNTAPTPQVNQPVAEIPKVTKLQDSAPADAPVRTVNKVYPMKVMPPNDNPQAPTQVIRDPPMEAESSDKVVQEPERKVTVIPITQNKNGNNHVNKPNSLKLIFQKQTQDGFYKISNQNLVPKTAELKTNSVSSQTIPVRSVKVKPRILTVVEKHKETGKLSSSLQAGNKINGAPNALQLQNAKIPPLKQKVCVTNNNSTSSITYEVHSQDGFSCTSSSITEVWQKVFEAVQEAREAHKMPRLPENPFATASAGLQMLGFRHNALRYLVEQLPGIGRCVKYKPRYHKLRPPGPEDDVDALPKENPSGCARSEPFRIRSSYDMFSWLASRHRQPPKLLLNAENESVGNRCCRFCRRATCSHLPMAMRFRHLKGTSKKAVGVYRSRIHGRGLFCLRDIEAGEMVIEYAGEVIRSMLTDKREKYYESKGIGCYMFRIDDQLVVDATMRGNAARFINHSCEPNCYSRVVDILGKKHILIFALRRIPQGEELTYDYKFPFEEIKIPCTCGSRKCRKYLN